ncbi:MAG: purine-nucleoside phosphorylase [Fusobacteria bacterium]|nr:purine-nucleoside phosphorylase [Fusobacteriota bacterium]
MPTPHISVTDKSKFAKTVLMPGDPLRAKYIAENFLENAELISSVRGMNAYTGTYKGRRITVMGSGMGMPSIGIYSFELFQFYGVENIVRIGSAGSYSTDLNVFDVVLVSEAFSESSYAKVQWGCTDNVLLPSKELHKKLRENACKLGIPAKEIRVNSSDVFYRNNFDIYKELRDVHGCMAVEMEAFSLFSNAMVTGKKAACLLTISDNLETMEVTTSEQRQNSFNEMIKIALELAE